MGWLENEKVENIIVYIAFGNGAFFALVILYRTVRNRSEKRINTNNIFCKNRIFSVGSNILAHNFRDIGADHSMG
jgi:hypothetical protein